MSVEEIQVIPFGVGWAVRVSTHECAESFHFTREQALQAANRMSTRLRAEVVVMGDELTGAQPT